MSHCGFGLKPSLQIPGFFVKKTFITLAGILLARAALTDDHMLQENCE